MKAIWHFVDRDTKKVIGTLTIEGDWSDEGFRAALTDLIEHYSENPYLISNFPYDFSNQSITKEKE